MIVLDHKFNLSIFSRNLDFSWQKNRFLVNIWIFGQNVDDTRQRNTFFYCLCRYLGKTKNIYHCFVLGKQRAGQSKPLLCFSNPWIIRFVNIIYTRFFETTGISRLSFKQTVFPCFENRKTCCGLLYGKNKEDLFFDPLFSKISCFLYDGKNIFIVSY